MEIESKSLLAGRREHERLTRALAPPLRRLDQLNHYFDTRQQDWARHRVAVRLRWENGRPELTVKTAGESRGDFVIRGEFECALEVREAERLEEDGLALTDRVFEILRREEPGLAQSLAPLRDEALGRVGSMRTQRLVFALERSPEPAREIEVDETVYPDGSVGWEVELEVDAADDQAGAILALRELLESLGIPWRPSRTSKRERLQRILDA